MLRISVWLSGSAEEDRGRCVTTPTLFGMGRTSATVSDTGSAHTEDVAAPHARHGDALQVCVPDVEGLVSEQPAFAADRAEAGRLLLV